MTAVTGSFNGTLGGTAVAYTFAVQWPEVILTNLAIATSTDVIYARADGTAATVAGAGCTAIGAGESVDLTNELAEWFPGDPGTDPGASISVISSGTATPFSVEGA